MEQLEQIVFYSIDKAIRSYRQFAQKRIKEIGINITIDQWLVIKAILENPTIPQSSLSELVFKDNASVTRIIANLKRDGYLKTKIDKTDRRKIILKVTKSGIEIIEKVQSIVLENREIALAGISNQEIETAQRVMNKIALNTKKS